MDDAEDMGSEGILWAAHQCALQIPHPTMSTDMEEFSPEGLKGRFLVKGKVLACRAITALQPPARAVCQISLRRVNHLEDLGMKVLHSEVKANTILKTNCSIQMLANSFQQP